MAFASHGSTVGASSFTDAGSESSVGVSVVLPEGVASVDLLFYVSMLRMAVLIMNGITGVLPMP